MLTLIVNHQQIFKSSSDHFSEYSINFDFIRYKQRKQCFAKEFVCCHEKFVSNDLMQFTLKACVVPKRMS